MIRLAIRVRAADAEVSLARLLGVLGAGAEEIETQDAVEYAVYGRADELPGEEELRALAGEALLGVARSPVTPGWERAWQDHLARIEVAGLALRPPWVAGAPGDLVIDPGPSFGVAGHPTTRLCLELLAALAPGGAMCDWGAGSGVLALAAARLGFAPVTAVELDAGAAAAARANAAAAGVALTVLERDLTRQRAPWAPTVVANLTLGLFESLAPGPRPERLIASGVLAGQADRVAPALGLREVARREAEDWAALLLERP